MSKILAKIKYMQTLRDIKAIVARGRGDLRMSPQKQILETNWLVGRYLAEEAYSADQDRLIRHLAREFSQPKVYFHTVIKFYKCYPHCPPDDAALTWEHYKALLTGDDA